MVIFFPNFVLHKHKTSLHRSVWCQFLEISQATYYPILSLHCTPVPGMRHRAQRPGLELTCLQYKSHYSVPHNIVAGDLNLENMGQMQCGFYQMKTGTQIFVYCDTQPIGPCIFALATRHIPHRNVAHM